jgi:hypothetical protein
MDDDGNNNKVQQKKKVARNGRFTVTCVTGKLGS